MKVYIGQIGGKNSMVALQNANKMFGIKYKNISVDQSMGDENIQNSWGVMAEKR